MQSPSTDIDKQQIQDNKQDVADAIPSKGILNNMYIQYIYTYIYIYIQMNK